MKNGVMIQYFEWYLPNDGSLWRHLEQDAPHLKETGVTSVWIPPAYKADEQGDEGYATYDLYDLGEFDQKGGVRTKYGTRAELLDAIEALHRCGISVYMDVVLNHKAGGDYPESFPVVEVAGDNRNVEISEQMDCEAFTGYVFPGRGDRYSSFKWHWHHFSGVDYNRLTGRNGIYRIIGPGKGWSKGVDSENGNYDFLMFNDLDLDNPDVAEELIRWGDWVAGQTGIDGVRMDAIKHMDYNFIVRFLDNLRARYGNEFYAVGEYWNRDHETLVEYVDKTGGCIDLFDVPLHFNFHEASRQHEDYDLSTILDGSLVSTNMLNVVTFVDNHDSQPGCSLESWVEDWFKPHAYAIILLMKEGYPCIFYGDYYGMKGDDSPHRHIMEILLEARRRHAFGDQQWVLDDPHMIALLRYGDEDHHGSGMVMIASNAGGGAKTVDMGVAFAGTVWKELTGSITGTVTLSDRGYGDFPVEGRNISVWVMEYNT